MQSPELRIDVAAVPKQGAKQVDRVVIYLVICSAGFPDAVDPEGGRESSTACHIHVKVADEVIPDVDARSRSDVYSVGAKSSGAVAVNRLNFVAVDRAVCWAGGHFDGIGA